MRRCLTIYLDYAEMTLAPTSSPNPGVKFGDSGGGDASPLPNTHDIEDKRFSFLTRIDAASVQPCKQLEPVISVSCPLGSWINHKYPSLPSPNMEIPGWRLQCFPASAVCCCAHAMTFSSCSKIQSAVPGFPSRHCPKAQHSESAGQGSDPPPVDCSPRSKSHTRIRRTCRSSVQPARVTGLRCETSTTGTVNT